MPEAQYDVEIWNSQTGEWMTLDAFTTREAAMLAFNQFVAEDTLYDRDGQRYRLVITTIEDL